MVRESVESGESESGVKESVESESGERVLREVGVVTERVVRVVTVIVGLSPALLTTKPHVFEVLKVLLTAVRLQQS